MQRRDLLLGTSVLVGSSLFPRGWTTAADKKKQTVLYFTASCGFEHGVVKRKGEELSFSEKQMLELGKKAGFEVVCSKDGRLFDGDLGQYDCLIFYTSGDLTKPPKNPAAGVPMSPEGKQKLLAAVAAGKGFVGIHAATDSFRSAEIDPYIAMLGGEFISHGAPQVAKVTVASPKFPGIGNYDSLTLKEEWYAQHKFAKDLHVILVQETAEMKGGQYERPNYPATWARMHEKGRVFYTSFGHFEEVWTNPQVQEILLGGIAWALRNVDADVTPNIDKVTPQANQTRRAPV